MKHFGTQLDKILSVKRMPKKEFASKMGVTNVTVSKWCGKDNIDAQTLERISRLLHTPISYWFDGDVADNSGEENHTDIAIISAEIGSLKALLNEKERTIQILLKQKELQ